MDRGAESEGASLKAAEDRWDEKNIGALLVAMRSLANKDEFSDLTHEVLDLLFMLKNERKTIHPVSEDDALTFATSSVPDDGDVTEDDDELPDAAVSAASIGTFVRAAK